MRLIIHIARILTGALFIFSGAVKAIDPLGSAYKFQSYFQAFDIGFLDWMSLPLAIFLCTTEFIAGFSVLTGFRQKTGIWIVMILIAFFTPLTFFLALTNPVSDCGCFGDAIKLTNWQTFGKNIILFALVLVLFTGRKKIKNTLSTPAEWIILTVTMLIFILFSLANLRYLPVIDFLPYKTGTKIEEKMIIPEGETIDKYMTTFIYEKDGEKKEFSLENYPADDTSWKFVDQKSVLISKGYEPPIHDFIITSMNGEDLTPEILAFKGYTLLMISKKLEESAMGLLTDGFELGRYCMDIGIEFQILTSSVSTEVKNYENDLPYCFVDETTLKTMVRANPGYILLKDGTIIGKWSWSNVPGKEWFRMEKTTSSDN